MIIHRKLRITSPWLAIRNNGDRENPKRVFRKLTKLPREGDPSRVYIYADLERWEWAFLEARQALSLSDVAVSAIIPGNWYSAKNTSTYNRQFRRESRLLKEKFESISAGQVIDTHYTLSTHVPPNTDGNGRFTRAPDEQEFDAMLAHVGEFLGMSEWGHGKGYGRFEIRGDVEQEPASEHPPNNAHLQDIEEN